MKPFRKTGYSFSLPPNQPILLARTIACHLTPESEIKAHLKKTTTKSRLEAILEAMTYTEELKPTPIPRDSLVKHFSNDKIKRTVEVIIVYLYGDTESVDPGNQVTLAKLAATWRHHSRSPGSRKVTADDLLHNTVIPALKKIHAIHVSVNRLGLGVGPADVVRTGDKIAVLKELGWSMDMDEFHEEFTQYRSVEYFKDNDGDRKVALEEMRVRYERSVPEEIKYELGLLPDRRARVT